MSNQSQTTVLGQMLRYRYVVLWIAGIGGLVALAPYALAIFRMATRAHLHGPDLDLLAAQPLIIQLHIAGAVLALLVGAILMTQRKGVTWHRIGGWVWASAMALVAGSSIFITGINGDHWSFIHLFTGWTLIALPIAVLAAKRHNVQMHRRFMMGLFYGGLVITGLLTFIPGRTMWNLFLG